MNIRCINCGGANVEPKAAVQLQGVVRGETYTVEMPALVCPKCGYTTLPGLSMPEYGRLLADKYRAAHGLLTSDEIRERRERMGLSQQNFADYLRRGVASVKRWEMGKIQEPANDVHIREMTQASPSTTLVYMADYDANMAVDGSLVGAVGITGGTTTTTIREAIFIRRDENQTQGCIICGQTAQRHTTSAFDIRDLSSDHSTSLYKATKVKGLLNA